MSIFSSIGKALGSVAKSVGTVALNVGGGIIGDNHLGTDIFSGSSTTGSVQTAQPMMTDSVGNVTYGTGFGVASGAVGSVQTSPSILDQLKGLLLVASGNKPIQTEVNSSAVPSWLLPVGLGLAAIIGLKAVSRR